MIHRKESKQADACATLHLEAQCGFTMPQRSEAGRARLIFFSIQNVRIGVNLLPRGMHSFS